MKYEVVKEKDYTDFSKIKKQDPTKMMLCKSIFATGVLTLTLPMTAYAAEMDGTFLNVHNAVMNAFDAGVVLVIIFAGASWGLGHRSKAIEILIGVCCGYILARHAIDIRDFLKGI